MEHYADISTFFAKVGPLESYYDNLTFAFLAIREGNEFVIWRSRLQYNIQPQIEMRPFQTDNIRAGRYSLSELQMDASELVGRLISGDIEIDEARIRFKPNVTGRFDTIFHASHPEFDQTQKRAPVLEIFGDETAMPSDTRNLDWELRSAATPFDTIGDLGNFYLLNPVGDSRGMLQVIAFSTVEIDHSSSVVGNRATIGAITAKGFPRDKISVGYRVMLQNQSRPEIITRATIAAKEFTWEEIEGLQRGKASIDVPTGAVVHCYAIFDGNAQHHYYIGDSEHHPNQKRSIFELFDKDLHLLREALTIPPGRGKGDGKAFEIAVSTVLWMLGFAVSNIGFRAKTSDAPDVFATTPFGNFMIIECTTGLLKAESKLANLVARTVTIRDALQRSASGRRALPVIVTQRSRAQVVADIPDAERNGVLVVASEDLERLLDRTLFVQDIEAAFTEAENKVQQALEIHRQM